MAVPLRQYLVFTLRQLGTEVNQENPDKTAATATHYNCAGDAGNIVNVSLGMAVLEFMGLRNSMVALIKSEIGEWSKVTEKPARI